MASVRRRLPGLCALVAAVLIASAGCAQAWEIDTVVVLMLENRAFDGTVGWLKQEGLPDLDGLTGGAPSSSLGAGCSPRVTMQRFAVSA